MKNLAQYSKLIQEYHGQPHNMANLLTEMSGDYSEASDYLMRLERKFADFYNVKKFMVPEGEKVPSDKGIEMLFMKEGDGIKMQEYEMYRKTLERLQSNIKAVLRVYESESKNLY